jgi:DDE superfamily endonuclease
MSTDRLVAVCSPLTLSLTSVQDSFNCFLSTLRILVEQTFGVVVARWGILRSPLRCSLAKASKISVVCCKLHQYIVDQRDKAGITAGVPSVPAVDPNNRTQGQVQVFVQDVLHLDSEASRHVRQGQGAADEADTERCAGAGGRRAGPWRRPQ